MDTIKKIPNKQLGEKVIADYPDATLPIVDTDVSIINRAGIFIKTTILNIKNNIIDSILSRNNTFTGNNNFERNVVVKGESGLIGNALEVRNSNNSTTAQFKNAGGLVIGTPVKPSDYSLTQINTLLFSKLVGADVFTGIHLISDTLWFRSYIIGNNTSVSEINSIYPLNQNEIRNGLRFKDTLTASTGTAQYRAILIDLTINQTGTSSGVTRGIHINPTITSVADFRAVESTFGGGYFNTNSVQSSAILQADSTTKGFLPPRMTTLQRDIISSPANGLIIYNTTTNKHQGYNGTWNDMY